MTDSEDPIRLFDSPEAPAGLRDALQRARADVGTDADLARLAAKLGPLLGPAAPLAPATAPGRSSVVAKLGVGGLALLAVGGAVWLLSAQKTSVPAPLPAATAHVSAPPPLVEPPAPLVPATPSRESIAPEPPSAAKPTLPTKPAATVPSEADLLEQARAALKSGDSARALARATEHARRYPRGVLVQEREVLAIQALRGLGRQADAERRAEAFAKAYPGSAFQRKLQR
ncbi:MAG: hypothetical protein EOO73_33590 [Myxococcales bacterium]|nr:MAG: hypothetical protein EOO73_33590 [Myxococcales bacterium]